MKLTRHNGRTGKNGVYNPKHNDRQFDIDNSDHIDLERAKRNVYWDCYNGIRSASVIGKEDEIVDSFEEVEQLFYKIHYQDYVEGQNARNLKNHHPERNRTMQKRKDHKGRVLKDGETYRKNDGLYMYRWIGGDKKRHQEYHRQVAYIILDSYGKMIMEECQNGFDEKTKQKLHELMKEPEQKEQEHQKYKDRLEHYQKFFENGTYERSWESGTEGNYNMVDGQVNNLKSAEEKRVERKPAQRPEQSSKKKLKKKESVIKRLREKQIAIAVKSGKPVPRYLEQEMERRRG